MFAVNNNNKSVVIYLVNKFQIRINKLLIIKGLHRFQKGNQKKKQTQNIFRAQDIILEFSM